MNASLSLGSELDLLLPITALLPVTALLLVSQSNPYQTLVLRGILGSVATLLYALLGLMVWNTIFGYVLARCSQPTEVNQR